MKGLTVARRFCRQNQRLIKIVLVSFSLLLYVGALWCFRDLESFDMMYFCTPWWDYIRDNGFAGISSIYTDGPGIWVDYPPTYYFLMFIFSRLPFLGSVLGVKLISAVFGLFAAAMIYFIIKHFRPKTVLLPAVAACVSLFLPMAFANTVLIGQCDVIYTGFILASFLAIVKDRPWLAWSLFGVAICFKLMAVFFLPFLIYWYFRDWKGWKRFSNLAPLSSVATIIILSILSVLAGNAPFGRIVDLYAVWSTYKSHFHTFLVGGPVASLWNFYNDINLKYLAIGLAVVLVLAAMLYVWKFVRFKQSSLKTGIDWQLLILFTTIVLPYTLPYMLDRYLFLAGMMSFVICLINPRREFYIIFAVLMYVTFWSWDIFVWSDAIFSSGDDFMLFNVVVSTILIGGLLIYLGHLISKNRTIPKKESAK